MAKRKTRKKQTKRNSPKKQNLNFKIINALLAVIVALIAVIIVVLFLYDTEKLNETKQDIKSVEKVVEKKVSIAEEKSKKELDKYFHEFETKKGQFEEYTKEFYKEYVHKEQEKEEATKALEEKPKESEETKTQNKFHEVLSTTTSKPKLAIVIDDVSNKYQVNRILNLGYKTTIAVMPPTPGHPNSAKIVQNLPFYMIHFPLQAKNFTREEKGTLHIDDSYETIEKRVEQIRQWYPTARFTNNHTGSKFTENAEAMDKLFKALVKYNFVFVDSRTTSKTVAKEMAEKYNMQYIVRNVFLDNEHNFDYIQNQLKKAIKISKKNGYAIAICHPHAITLKVLKESTHLLEDLELVYLNQLPNVQN